MLAQGLPAGRLTVTLVRPGGPDLHAQLRADRRAASARTIRCCGVHPEAAARIDLDRLRGFELSRLPAPEPLYAFHGKSRAEAGDERIFVLGDLRTRSPDAGREASLHLPAFEHLFYEATRALRGILIERDPQRRLQWNRIAIYVATEIFLDGELAERLSRKLEPATRNLGLEKVLVRLHLLEREAPEAPARATEIVISNLTGSSMTIQARAPVRGQLSPTSEYERKVVDARRRRLVYPYEILRMLTGSGAASGIGDLALPAGEFEEYDLDAGKSPPRAISVAGRPYGRNSCGVVFGVITTPTEKVPEGMKRVIVLSDPTRGMGSLAAPECDRVAAAIDLAESLRVPLEWLPVSSGARIAMDSGTENLDATARVVRRIIEFTQAGRRDPRDRERRQRGRAVLLGCARDDAAAHARRADHDAERLDGADRPRRARGFGRGRRRGRAGDRRLRAHHGAERRGAVPGQRPRRCLPHPLRALPHTATWCRASAGRGRCAARTRASARWATSPARPAAASRRSARSSTIAPTRGASGPSRCAR